MAWKETEPIHDMAMHQAYLRRVHKGRSEVANAVQSGRLRSRFSQRRAAVVA